MRAVQAGVGALQALASHGQWRVVASFPKALYIGSDAGLVMLVSPGVPLGPLHVVLDQQPAPVQPGVPVVVSPDRIVVAGWTIALVSMRRWEGRIPCPERVRTGAAIAAMAVDGPAKSSALHEAGYRCRANRAFERLKDLDLEGGAGFLAGLGPGLTPAGDDVLAGLLFMCRLLWGVEYEPQLVDLATASETGEISRAFLTWAARGQSVAPAHDLVSAAALGDPDQAVLAGSRLRTLGASSGADFALGLGWALRFPVPRSADGLDRPSRRARTLLGASIL